MKKTTLRHRSERGQSLVEMALSMTVILLLLAGVVEVGRAFFILVQMRDAAQEGAVYGSIHPTQTGAIQDRAFDVLPPALRNPQPGTSTSIQVNVIGAPCTGNRISVTVRYTYPTTMPFFAGRTLPLSATAIDTILQPTCP